MIQKEKQHTRNIWLALFIIIITLFNLFLLYYIKYDNQHLPISYFNWSYIGNIFNLIFNLFLIAGLVVYIFSKRSKLPTTFVYFLASLMTIFLFAAWIFSKSRFHLPDITILNQPLNKIFAGGLFFIYQFIQFIITIQIWFSVTGKSGYIFIRSFIDSIIITFILLLFAFLYPTFSQTETAGQKTAGDGINVGVVLGAAVWTNEPSPSLRSRVDKAYNLYENGKIQKIQLTGGNAPGELSESEIAFRYLKTRNIDTSNIWIEKNTSSTAEQIQFIKNKLSIKHNIGNITVISDSYHLPRIKQIADFYHLKLKVSASDLDLKFENKIYYKIRESAAILIFWFFAI